MRVLPLLPTTLALSLGLAFGAGPALAQTGGGAEPPPAGGSAPPQQGSDGGAQPGNGADTGGQQYGAPDPAATPVVDGVVGKILADGTAAAPSQAPPEVQQAIWAANRIIGLPYVYGGGHRSFRSRGYDCSGTISFALHGAKLLSSPLDSSSFMRWGAAGPGQWITVYTNPGHAFMVIAGLRLDTSAAGDPSGARGPRWRPVLRSTRGFHRRHPIGF